MPSTSFERSSRVTSSFKWKLFTKVPFNDCRDNVNYCENEKIVFVMNVLTFLLVIMTRFRKRSMVMEQWLRLTIFESQDMSQWMSRPIVVTSSRFKGYVGPLGMLRRRSTQTLLFTFSAIYSRYGEQLQRTEWERVNEKRTTGGHMAYNNNTKIIDSNTFTFNKNKNYWTIWTVMPVTHESLRWLALSTATDVHALFSKQSVILWRAYQCYLSKCDIQ